MDWSGMIHVKLDWVWKRSIFNAREMSLPRFCCWVVRISGMETPSISLLWPWDGAADVLEGEKIIFKKSRKLAELLAIQWNLPRVDSSWSVWRIGTKIYRNLAILASCLQANPWHGQCLANTRKFDTKCYKMALTPVGLYHFELGLLTS